MDESNGSIHRWLASLKGPPQSYHDRDEKQNQHTNGGIAQNFPHMQLEGSNLKGLGHPSFRKRNADQVDKTNTSTPEEVLQKRPRQNYELRSRQKTREDHYEYKGPSSVVGSQSQVAKTKAKKSRRRHTMNDDFHAINVTKNRLTLRNNTNLGIFSKGKTSSTTHPRASPPISRTNAGPSKKPHKQKLSTDLPFSEMMFTSNVSLGKKNIGPDFIFSPTGNTLFEAQGKDRNETCPPLEHYLPNLSKAEVPHVNIPLAAGQREAFHLPPRSLHDLELPSQHTSKVDVFNLDKPLDKRQLEEPYSSHPLLKDPEHSLRDSPRVGMLINTIQQEISHSPLPSKRDRSSSLHLPQKKRKVSEDSPSIIPYTWTETEDDNTEREHALERHLLASMHVGMAPEGISNEISHFVFTGKYWNLSELWTLLEERKVLWSKEASRQQAALGKQTTSHIIAQNSSALFDVDDIHDEVANQSEQPEIAVETGYNTYNSVSVQDSVPRNSKGFTHQGLEKDESLMLSEKVLETYGGNNESTCRQDDHQHLTVTRKCADEQLLTAFASEFSRSSLDDIDLHGLSQVEDDDMFYETLDAVYHAIVRSEVAAEVASNLQELLTSPDHNNPFRLQGLPHSTPFASPQKSLPEKGTREPTLSVPVPEHINQKLASETVPPEPSNTHEVFSCHDDESFYGPITHLPWLAANEPQSHSSMTNQIGQISGFWRQNKLY